MATTVVVVDLALVVEGAVVAAGTPVLDELAFSPRSNAMQPSGSPGSGRVPVVTPPWFSHSSRRRSISSIVSPCLGVEVADRVEPDARTITSKVGLGRIGDHDLALTLGEPADVIGDSAHDAPVGEE